ncbi:ArsR/SmtB family transcription factor [Hamadaea tsunoensis]|uniref:ArsR/SmtB family transcription factor n=1 Tax=Hamadaea tsunoensis TaxID=53368 RepID=UPI0003FBBEB1|nr:metalloregulator ArsR/SmtB family transcription factor [Hamadaea tsunoensis]
MTDEEPQLTDVPVTAVLFALSDPTRLDMVIELRGLGETPCGTLRTDLPKATRSHHLKVLREAGLTRQRREGTAKYLRLREDELAQRFPGLLDTVLADAAAHR